MNAKGKITELLVARGISVNGTNPWDIQIKDKRFYSRLIAEGSLGLGESYMDGWWECEKIEEFIARLLNSKPAKHVPINLNLFFYYFVSHIANLQSKRGAMKVVTEHYDIGNDIYERMLGPTMVYTCAYWSGTPPAKNLDEAQTAKLDLACRKLGLKKGMRILDVGCGFGAFAKHAAQNYGVEVVGISISKEQIAFAKKHTEGLPVEIRFQDYRDMKGEKEFDRIASFGMIEHVGYRNHRTYFKIMNRLLKDDGLFFLHTIGDAHSTYQLDPWLDKYILPHGNLPSLAQLSSAMERSFIVEDVHNIGADYHQTLMSWFANFDRTWPEISQKYGGERFYRMWKYYLLICAGGFLSRRIHLFHFVLSKRGIPGGYKTIR